MSRALVTDAASAAAYARWYRRHRKAFGPIKCGETPHGTRRRYVDGCRCDPCRAANADYKAQYRLRKQTTPEAVTPNLPRPKVWICRECGRLNRQAGASTCIHTPPWVQVDRRVATECRAMAEEQL